MPRAPDDFRGKGLSELLPRYVFLEPLVPGARVLELGAVALTGGESAVLLHDRGAASVISVGAQDEIAAARDAHEGPGLFFRAGPLADLPAATIDLALVHDPAAVDDEDLDELSRILTPTGSLLIATPAHGPALVRREASRSSYAELLQRLTRVFPSIQVLTQQAIVGYAVAPAGIAEPGLLVDDEASAGEAAAYHLFLCGRRATGLREQALVTLPAAPWLAPAEKVAPGAAPRLEARIAELLEELGREKHRVQELRAEARKARDAVAERESWIEGLRHEVETRHAGAEELAAELQTARVKLIKLEREHADAAEALRRVREQLVVRNRELDGARRAIDARTEDLHHAEEERDQLQLTLRNSERAKLELGAQLAAATERAAEAERKAGETLASLLAQRTRAVELDARAADATATLAAERRRSADLEARLAEAERGETPRDDLERRLRDAEERAELAQLRAREAEERMRAAERRADAAETERADASNQARRWQDQAESAQRDAAGVAAAMADRQALQVRINETLARAEAAERRLADLEAGRTGT